MSNKSNDELLESLYQKALEYYEDPDIALYWAEKKLEELS